MRRVLGEMLQCDGRPRQKIEQRLEPIVKQRQPMLHAGVAAAFADRFIEKVVRRRGAEFSDIARAKTADGLSDELKLRNRHKIEPPQLFFAALGLRVEHTDCFKRVAEKIETDSDTEPRRLMGGKAPPHRIPPRLPQGRGAYKAIELKPVDDPLHAD